MKSTGKYYILYVLLFSAFALVGARMGYQDDVDFWTRWAQQILHNGLGNAYDVEDNNYNPLYQYILFFYTKLANTDIKIQHYHSFLKLFTLAFDFIGAIVASRLVDNKENRFFCSLLLLFNAGYLYNTMVWEQVDAIYTCLSFVAVFFALRQRITWSVVFYLLALNAKLQAIMFLPVLLLLWLPAWLKSGRSVATAVVSGAALQLLLLAPFIWGGYKSYLDKILDINFRSVDFYPFVTVNAYNLWAVLFKGPLTWSSDSELFWSHSYKFWGLLLFVSASFLVILPLFLVVVSGEIKRNYSYRQNHALILLTFAMVPLVFCYFNTQMHERYWHSAILFLGAYSFVSKRYFVFVVASIAYFLNLEDVLHFLQLLNYGTLLFDYRFVAALFGIAILVGVREIYWHANLRSAVAGLGVARANKASAVAG